MPSPPHNLPGHTLQQNLFQLLAINLWPMRRVSLTPPSLADELRGILVGKNELLTLRAGVFAEGLSKLAFADRGEAGVGMQVERAALVWAGGWGGVELEER